MSEQRKECRQIKFRVSENEYQQLSASAAAVGMSVPKFCKNKAQGKRIKTPLVDLQGALEITKELRKIGNNVNQLAYKANTNQTISRQELMTIQKELEEIWQLLSLGLRHQPTD